MKKFIALFLLLSIMTLGLYAQEPVAIAEGQDTATVVADSVAAPVEEVVEEKPKKKGFMDKIKETFED